MMNMPADMRRKLPIGIQSFEFLRSEGYLYIDKTELIYRLVTEGKPYFLSRPRRFGKSLLLSTLEAYFKGKKELFKGLAIEQLEQEWLEYPVLHLDLNAEKYDSNERLEKMLERQLEGWEAQYGADKGNMTYSGRFSAVIRRAYEQTGHRVVVLVDEYDKPMLQTFDNPGLQEEFRKTLTAFYTVLKSADPYLQFVFITGVTKFAQMGIFSTLNQLNDISLDLRELDGIEVSSASLNSYEVNISNIIPIFYQSGFLTIKAYDDEFREYTLSFPNEEVKYGLLNFVANSGKSYDYCA